jgi:hypothetical protein
MWNRHEVATNKQIKLLRTHTESRLTWWSTSLPRCSTYFRWIVINTSNRGSEGSYATPGTLTYYSRHIRKRHIELPYRISGATAKVRNAVCPFMPAMGRAMCISYVPLTEDTGRFLIRFCSVRNCASLMPSWR